MIWMRWIEMAVIFLGIPLLLRGDFIPRHKIIVLLCVCSVCLIPLLRDKTFNLTRFGLNGFRSWRTLAARYLIISSCLALYTVFAEPENVLAMLGHNPARWALIMFTYPVFSVVPQEIIYRAFFFHRYSTLLPDKKISVLVNAALFAFGHILFRNWVAIIGAFGAGLLWATTYLGSRSILLVSIEHALYGDLAFTLGIGHYFYSADF